MGCYSPMIRYYSINQKKAKALDGHLYFPAKIIKKETFLEQYDSQSGAYRYQEIPCGKCIGCRLDYSREWANRGYLESLQSKHNYFITLTYNDENLPMKEEITTKEGITFTEDKEVCEWKGILVPEHVKTFINSLRKHFERKPYFHTGIRFMIAGEYGDKNKRPHYHLILFNCPFPLNSFYKPRLSWNKDIYYQNKIIEKYWDYGISNICEANWANIAYTARYITKKINGEYSEEHYALQGQIKEFFMVSTHPGIGYKYYEDHKKEIYEKDKILVRNGETSHWVQPPKYFDKLYEKENPKEFKKIKERRQLNAKKSKKFKDTLTSVSRYEQLKIEERTKEDKAKTLRRNIPEI